MKLFKRTVTLLLSLMLISGIITFFLAFYDSGKTKITDYEKEKILSVLDEHNIDIKADILPENYPDLPVINLKNAVHERLLFAKGVLGRDFSVSSSDTYVNDDYVLTIAENEFSIDFSDNPLLKKEFMLTNPENYGTLIKKAVSKLGFDDSEIKIVVNNKDSYATVFRTIDGYPVFDCTFRVKFKDGILRADGIWFNPTNKKYYQKHKSLTTIINDICQNSDFSGKEITEITAGYKIGKISGYEKEVTAIPVWRITFDDKVTYDYKM